METNVMWLLVTTLCLLTEPGGVTCETEAAYPRHALSDCTKLRKLMEAHLQEEADAQGATVIYVKALCQRGLDI